MITSLLVDVGSGAESATGLRLGVAWARRDGDRHQYRYWVTDAAGIVLHRGDDLRRGVGHPIDHPHMLGTLLSFLLSDTEAYASYEMGHRGQEPPDGYLFGRTVSAWAYQLADELALAREDLEADN